MVLLTSAKNVKQDIHHFQFQLEVNIGVDKADSILFFSVAINCLWGVSTISNIMYDGPKVIENFTELTTKCCSTTTKINIQAKFMKSFQHNFWFVLLKSAENFMLCTVDKYKLTYIYWHRSIPYHSKVFSFWFPFALKCIHAALATA